MDTEKTQETVKTGEPAAADPASVFAPKSVEPKTEDLASAFGAAPAEHAAEPAAGTAAPSSGSAGASGIETLTGTVVFIMTSRGSKSEGKKPYLYQQREKTPLPLWKSGDNPFQNDALDAYDGKKVEITGKPGRRGVFTVETIKEL